MTTKVLYNRKGEIVSGVIVSRAEPTLVPPEFEGDEPTLVPNDHATLRLTDGTIVENASEADNGSHGTFVLA